MVNDWSKQNILASLLTIWFSKTGLNSLNTSLMIRNALVLFLILILPISCSLSAGKQYKGSKYYIKKEVRVSCKQFQKEALVYWPMDSLGENGFRLIAADVLVKCKCYMGLDWTELEKKLGKPDFDEPIIEGRIKSYTLIPEFKYLTVFVNEKGVIYKLVIRQRDG